MQRETEPQFYTGSDLPKNQDPRGSCWCSVSNQLKKDSWSENGRFPVEMNWKCKAVGRWRRAHCRFRFPYCVCVCARMPWLVQFCWGWVWGVQAGLRVAQHPAAPRPNPTPSPSVLGKRLRNHIHIRAVLSSSSICHNGYNVNTNQKRFSFKRQFAWILS